MPLSNLSDTKNEEYILLIIIFIVILCILYNFWCLFGPYNNDEKNISANENPAELRLYYASWCGHSVALIENGWKKCKQIIENDEYLNKIISIREIDCDNNSEKCTISGVVGFPTIKLFISGREIEYVGDRTENSIIQFVKKNI